MTIPILRDDAAEASPTRVRLALLIFAALLATILAALGFEHVGGYLPCALCLLEREPYYAGLAFAAAAAYGAHRRAPGCFTPAMFLGLAALMIYGMALGSYHAGVEWALWPGPPTCAGDAGAPATLDALREGLSGATVAPSCDRAVWRFAGLSFAGWNVIASAAVAAIAVHAAFRRS